MKQDELGFQQRQVDSWTDEVSKTVKKNHLKRRFSRIEWDRYLQLHAFSVHVNKCE